MLRRRLRQHAVAQVEHVRPPAQDGTGRLDRFRQRVAAIRRPGSITWRSNCAGGNSPAQLSNSITASAPASICAHSMVAVASVSRSISRSNSAGSA